MFKIEPSKIQTILIHGPSASGKSTFAKNLYNCIQENKKVFLIQLDNYYKTVKGENHEKYDFDNPAVLDWKKINNLIKSINDKDEYLKIYEYCFIERISKGPFLIKNNFPEILIIEGIFAMNIFNKICFDIKKFDPTDSTKEGYMINPNIYFNLNVFSIRMVVCKEKMCKIKICRDILERNHTKEEAKFMFLNQSWPAAMKWIYSDKFKADVDIIHGSFNKKCYESFFNELTFNMIGKSSFKNELVSDISSIDCSRECMEIEKSITVLEDN